LSLEECTPPTGFFVFEDSPDAAALARRRVEPFSSKSGAKVSCFFERHTVAGSATRKKEESP